MSENISPANSVIRSSYSRWNYLDLQNKKDEEVQERTESSLGSGYNYVQNGVYPVNGVLGSRGIGNGYYARLPVDIFSLTIGKEEGEHIRVGAGLGLFTMIPNSINGTGISGAQGTLGFQLQSFKVPLYENCTAFLKVNAGGVVSELVPGNDFAKRSTTLQVESDAAGIYIDRLFDINFDTSGGLAFLAYTNWMASGDGMDAYRKMFLSDVSNSFTQWYQVRFTLNHLDSPKLYVSPSLMLYWKVGKTNNEQHLKSIFGATVTTGRFYFNAEGSEGDPYTTLQMTPPAKLNLTTNYKIIDSGNDYLSANLGFNNLFESNRMGWMAGLGFHIASWWGMTVDGNFWVDMNKNEEVAPVGPGSCSDTQVITKFIDPGTGGNLLLAEFKGHSRAMKIDVNTKMELKIGTVNANGLAGIVYPDGNDPTARDDVWITGLNLWDATDDSKDPVPVPLDPADVLSICNKPLPNMTSDGDGGFTLQIPTKSGTYDALNGKDEVVYNIDIFFATTASNVQGHDPGGNLRKMTIKVIFKRTQQGS